MKNPWLRFVPFVLLGCWIGAAPAGVPGSQPADHAPLSPDEYLEHIKYLASDALEGRLPGTEGIELAAEYIAKCFADAGLKPAGDDDTYFQQFEVERGKKLVEAAAALTAEGIDERWRVRRDWIPLPFTAPHDVEGPLAFAGYCIQADAYEYDDYADFDAAGKILLVFRYEPPADDPDADFGGRILSRHALFSRKVQVADRHGAKALLVVDPPRREGAEEGLYPFDEDLTEQTFELPVVHVTRAVAEALVQRGGLGDLASLQERLDRERQPLSADLNLRVELRPGVRPRKLPTRNVLGLLPGRGDTDEVIVLGAHYDHLGRARSQVNAKDMRLHIHRGADDNASGTAALLELARAFNAEPKLRRGLLFIAFSAEEMGLIGSAHFVAHPTVALPRIKAMMNFDMIGRLRDDKFTIYGLPTGREFGEIVDRAAAEAGLKYRAPQAGLFECSDHASFYAHDIPVLFAFTGIHKQYHTPEDDWPLIDAPGAATILAMFRQIVRELANLEAGPTFERITEQEESEEDVPVKQPGLKAKEQGAEDVEAHEEEAGRDARDLRRPSRPAVRLGIVPDYGASDEPGLVVGSVIEGGVAKAAGLLAGDRIVKIGEQKVMDIYGYMNALRDRQPGDALEVVVVRKTEGEAKEVTLKVTLK